MPVHAAGVVGIDLVPFGRSDLAWVESGQLSGTLVAETDGLLSPPLSAWGGWAGDRSSLLVGFSTVRFTTETWVLGEDEEEEPVRTELVVGALRPSFDYRRYFVSRGEPRVRPYLSAGLYSVIPMVRYESTVWTVEEQAGFDETADEDRARIGALGWRIGGGAEVCWDTGLSLGARYLLVGHRGRSVTSETARLSTLLFAEAALTLGFYFPP